MSLPRRNSFISNVLSLSTGTALAQGITIAVSPFLTRIYAPQDFGTLGVYISIITMLVIVSSGRYELAIPLPVEPLVAVNLLTLSILVLLGMTAFTSLCLWLFGEKLVQWAQAPLLIHYLWLLPLSLLGAGTYQILSNWATRHKAFHPLARTKLTQGAGQALAQLTFGVLGFRPSGLLFGDVIGRTAGSGTLLTLNWRKDKEAIKKVSIKGMIFAAARYRQFPVYSTMSGLINTAGLQAPIILVSSFYGPEVAGWFLLGQRLIGIPIVLLGRAVGQVFFAEASMLRRESEDPRAIKRLFFKLSKNLVLLSIPVGVISLIGPWIIPVVFGKDWAEAGSYLQALTLMSMLQIIVSPISLNLVIHEVQHWQLCWDIARLLIVISVFIEGYKIGLPASITIFFYGLLVALAYIVLYLINIYAINLKSRHCFL